MLCARGLLVSTARRLLCTAPRHTPQHWPRAFSSKTEPPAFGGEVAELYSLLFEQNWPAWHAIGNAVRLHASTQRPSILDLACGPGEPACHLATSFPKATVFGTDISADMVTKAQARAAAKKLNNLTCQMVDAQSLKQFDDASQDVVTVCYGLMFMPDLVGALSEMRRVLKPDGVLVVTVWSELPYIDKVKQIMTEVTAGPPPPPPINPLSLSEPTALDVPLAAAGFAQVEAAFGRYAFTTPTDPEVAWKMGVIPVWSALEEMQEMQASGAHGDAMRKARESFQRLTADARAADGSVTFAPGTYRLVVAKPC